MPLPEKFSEFEHLQDFLRKEHNKAVKLWFKNQKDDDISTPKAGLKHACLLKDADSASMTIMRLWLFEITVGRAQAIQTPIYGVPVQELQSLGKYKPQVKLYFKEPYDDELHKDGTPQSSGEITFRLIDETSQTITRTKAELLARQIKTEFATPVFTWEKGWFKATYLDQEKGYDLRLFVKSQLEGERVIKKVLSIQNHTYEEDNFQFIEHKRTYPVNPGTHRVYGKTVKKFRSRPRVDVKFRYAQLLIWGQMNPVNLVSVGGRLRSAIEQIPAPP